VVLTLPVEATARVQTARPDDTLPALVLVIVQHVLLASTQTGDTDRTLVSRVPLVSTAGRENSHVRTVLLVDILLPVTQGANRVPGVSMLLEPAHQLVPHALPEDTQVMDMVHVPIVRVEDTPQQVLPAAVTVLTASTRIELERQLRASHVLLGDTRIEEAAEALVLFVRLVDTPQLVLVVVLTVLLVNTPRPGLVRAARVPLVSTLGVDGADVITALLEGTQVPALVDARTVLTASIRRLHADPRV
jgi:acyl-CoA thioesterase FadM